MLRFSETRAEQRLLSVVFATQFLPPIDGETPQLKVVRNGHAQKTLTANTSDITAIAQAWFDYVDGEPVQRPAP